MEQSLLTLRDLVAMPALGQRVLAGAQGLDRVVLWAHSCEMSDPWRWLGPDELLMTVGLCVPADAAGQVQFVRRLAEAGLAGITIGDDEPAPDITPQMLAEADNLAFPILRTSDAVPFVSLGRTVAVAGSAREQHQLLLLSRLYRVLTSATASPNDMLGGIEEIFGVQLAVIDVRHRGVVLAKNFAPTNDLVADLCERAGSANLRSHASLPTDNDLRAWPLRTSRPSLLVVHEPAGVFVDSFLVGHLIQAMTAAVNNKIADVMARAARAEQLFSAIVLDQTPLNVLVDEAAAVGLDAQQQPLVALAISTPSPEDSVAALGSLGTWFLPRRAPGRVLCCARHADLDAILNALGPVATSVGVSNPFESLIELRHASRDAGWALDSAGKVDRVIHYREVRGSIVPRDAQAAAELSESVLGELLVESDRAERLLETLSQFLDHDRSWADTADALGVHRQTLAHRLRRIEQVTGRSLRSSSDIAALWVAVRAAKQARQGI